MADWYLWLTPLLGLGVLALARFVACDQVFGLERPPLVGEPFVDSFVLGTPRTNFTGWAGMTILVGDKPLTVTQLGRIMLTASMAPHQMKLVRPAGDDGVDLGTVTIPPSAAVMPSTDNPGFAYATLQPAVVLSANEEYYVVSHEAANGDVFHEVLDTIVTTTEVAQVTSGVYNDDADPRYRRFGGLVHTYGPVDFKYEESA